MLEELNLERSWIGFSRRTERFGQCGSLPVRQFFPFAALEDVAAGVFWGVQIPAPGSWHLEVSRCKDQVILSGGLPTADFGEWNRGLEPGETFATPPAIVASCAGDVDDLCQALTAAQIEAAEQHPVSERELPTIFNEWCSSWGEPSHDYVLATAKRLKEFTHTSILVIDDGWAAKPPGEGIQFNGDWEVDTVKFPGSLRSTCDALRELGFTPGLWFELEAATKGTRAFGMEDRHLRRAGKTIQVGKRRFWDLRDPLTRDYLTEKVTARLRDDGFGYLKIDYNETLPSGVDGPHGPGENLREHLLAVQSFITGIRREVPGIVIENCSSGGHRLEPSFLGLCAQSSFSDAHETLSIPIISANLHRLVLPRQLQVWCVVHKSDSLARIRYGLAATFLGRMCLSGDVKDLSDEQLGEIRAAQDFYRLNVSIIREGRSRVHSEIGLSWNYPRGWQAVVRDTPHEALVVVHTFDASAACAIIVPLPAGSWEVKDTYNLTEAPAIEGGELRIEGLEDFTGVAVRLVQKER